MPPAPPTLGYGHRSAFWTRKRLTALGVICSFVAAGLVIHRVGPTIRNQMSYLSAQSECRKFVIPDQPTYEPKCWANLAEFSARQGMLASVSFGPRYETLFLGERIARNGKRYLVHVEFERGDWGPRYEQIRATTVPVIGWFNNPKSAKWVRGTFSLGVRPTGLFSVAAADPRESSHLALMFSKDKLTLDGTRIVRMHVPVKLDLLLNDDGTVGFYPHVQPGEPILESDVMEAPRHPKPPSLLPSSQDSNRVDVAYLQKRGFVKAQFGGYERSDLSRSQACEILHLKDEDLHPALSNAPGFIVMEADTPEFHALFTPMHQSGPESAGMPSGPQVPSSNEKYAVWVKLVAK